MFKKDKEIKVEYQDFSEHLVRHLMNLKEIAENCNQEHPDLTKNRLQECAHILKKKFSIFLDGNHDEYHDYIQDFYDNQMQHFRIQIHGLQQELKSKDQLI